MNESKTLSVERGGGSLERVVRLRRRSKFSRLMYMPKIIKQCWKFTNHPAVSTKTRPQFTLRNVMLCLKG